MACECRGETAGLHAAIRAAAERRACANERYVTRGEHLRPMTISVVPISSSAWDVVAPCSRVVAVFLIEPEAQADRGVEIVGQAYGLTHMERRVLREIARCKGLPECAGKLDIALSTARTHLQRIFGKTATQNQAELIRLLLTSTTRM